MTMRDEDFGTALTLTEWDETIWSPPMSAPPSEPCDWQARAEMERARADAAEARAEELRWAEVAARSDAAWWKSRFKSCRQRLSEAEQETKDLRRAAKDMSSLRAEVARLEELLSEARSGSSAFGTIEALGDEVERLQTALASKARKDATGPLSRENARLRKALKRSQGQKDEIVALRGEVSARRKSERAAQTALSKESIRLGKALERTQKQKDTIKALREEVASLTRATRWQNRENGRLQRELEWMQSLKATARRLSDEVKRLREERAGYRDQRDFIDWQWRQIDDLRAALSTSAFERQELEAELADRPLLPEAVRRLREQEETIESLRTRVQTLEEDLAKLRSSRAVLSKALHGRKSEQQKKPGTGRKRGQQRGAPGHGRTPRPKLQEKTERRNPPQDARICSCCGKPYVANGERSTSLIEIEVKAHIRRIVRPRWRRGCECASSPLEAIAQPVPRLFPGTLFGTSFWARFLFEHCACLRPLCRVAAWYADQGLPVSPGTLANSQKRFVPLFDPLYEAILAHQNTAALRHADETGWRVQEFRDTGRSSRAWLWVSVSNDSVYYIIDPSRSAEVARVLFRNTACTVFLVCDRYSAYRTLARELDGKVILCWFRVGGVVAEPLPSQTRTSRFPASGSSHASFAYGGVQLMNEPGRRQRVPGEDCLHLVPGEPPFLAAARQPPLPGQDDALSEPPNAFAVACQTVVGVVPTEHAREASVLVREPPVAVSLAPLPDRSHRTGIAVLCRDLANDVLASSRLPPHVGKAEEVERRSHGRRMPPARTFEPEVDKARLGLVEREPESTEALRQHGKHAPAALKVFERQHWSSSGGEFHPSALTEPDMKLSPHPAPTLQPPAECRAATGRTDCGPVARHVQANAWTRAPGV